MVRDISESTSLGFLVLVMKQVVNALESSLQEHIDLCSSLSNQWSATSPKLERKILHMKASFPL